MEKYSFEQAANEAAEIAKKAQELNSQRGGEGDPSRDDYKSANSIIDEKTLGNKVEKEKVPINKVIVIDDNYAENLSDVFLDSHKDDEKKFNVDIAVDLETALQKIRSIEDTMGVAVLTDMYMPDKKGSFNPDEGLKVFGEIMEFYGMTSDMVKDKLARVKQIISEYGNDIEKVSIGRMGYSNEGEDIAKKIRDIFKNDHDLDNFLNKTICRGGNLYSIFKSWSFPPFSIEKDEKKLLENNILEEREDGKLDFADNFIIEHAEDFQNNVFRGRELISSMSYALLYGNDGGLPLGIRIAEEAHKKGLPIIVASGDHGNPGQANHIYADYLFKKGIINNPNVMRIDSEAANAQDSANKHSYFFARKFKSSETEANLKIITKALESKA